MKKIKKVVIVMALLSFLFGCNKTTEYSIDDIRSVSISCGHMDNSFSYSFYLREKDDKWLLDAQFCIDSQSPQIEYENHHIEKEDVDELLNIIKEQEIIEKVQKYKEKKSNIIISDETIYCTSIQFKDGEMIMAKKQISQDLTNYFYSLAEKYAE